MSILSNQIAVSRVGRWISALCITFACLGGAIFIIEALMSVISVIGRTFFSLPIPGDYELIQLFSVIGITAIYTMFTGWDEKLDKVKADDEVLV